MREIHKLYFSFKQSYEQNGISTHAYTKDKRLSHIYSTGRKSELLFLLCFGVVLGVYRILTLPHPLDLPIGRVRNSPCADGSKPSGNQQKWRHPLESFHMLILHCAAFLF